VKSIYTEIMELAESGATGVLVTVVDKTGSGPAATGTKMIVYPGGGISGTVGGGSIEKMAIEKALELMETKSNATEHYVMDDESEGSETGMVCGGSATLFFEYFAPKKHVYIFGAGHVGKALGYHLRKLNYRITVIDDREKELNDFKDADEKIMGDFEHALNDKRVDEGAFFIIATYQHKHDNLVLKKIYASGWKPAYIGMVSSRSKKRKIMEDLLKDIPDADMNLCYMPVGLDIGGTLPHEIAISIVAEMMAVANGRNVKHLREDP
jgi:xanthine dehydrogenase accessory factor